MPLFLSVGEWCLHQCNCIKLFYLYVRSALFVSILYIAFLGIIYFCSVYYLSALFYAFVCPNVDFFTCHCICIISLYLLSFVYPLQSTISSLSLFFYFPLSACLSHSVYVLYFHLLIHFLRMKFFSRSFYLSMLSFICVILSPWHHHHHWLCCACRAVRKGWTSVNPINLYISLSLSHTPTHTYIEGYIRKGMYGCVCERERGKTYNRLFTFIRFIPKLDSSPILLIMIIMFLSLLIS